MGIYFYEAQDSSILNHCVVVNAINNYGGINCLDSHPIIRNCDISHNRPYGIWCTSSNPTIESSTICHNWEMSGGGIYCGLYSSPKIINCQISNNAGGSGGGGIVCDDHSNPYISHCTISGNGGHPTGGGIDCLNHSSPTIEYCLITGNSGASGGGIYCAHNSSAVIDHCTITNNSGYPDAGAGGITIWYSDSITITNTIVEGNHGNGGIRFFNSTNVSISHCDVNSNENGNFTGEVPEDLGVLVATNTNGDSCDVFYNILLDPLFEDTTMGNYHLQSGSPCIDAGDPTYPYDPDSTIADIGAFFYDQSSVADPFEIPHPTEFRLSQNYPNPFNPITIIPFQLPYATHVSLKIYNILGQKVATLIDTRLTSGHHTATFDATHLPSGIYFYTFSSSAHTLTHKMVLLK